jgi:hypothetical protein
MYVQFLTFISFKICYFSAGLDFEIKPTVSVDARFFFRTDQLYDIFCDVKSEQQVTCDLQLQIGLQISVSNSLSFPAVSQTRTHH